VSKTTVQCPWPWSLLLIYVFLLFLFHYCSTRPARLPSPLFSLASLKNLFVFFLWFSFQSMERTLLKDFELQHKNPSVEALRRWRSAVTLVKNRRRRFRMVADLDKRDEAQQIRQGIKVFLPLSSSLSLLLLSLLSLSVSVLILIVTASESIVQTSKLYKWTRKLKYKSCNEFMIHDSLNIDLKLKQKSRTCFRLIFV